METTATVTSRVAGEVVELSMGCGDHQSRSLDLLDCWMRDSYISTANRALDMKS